MLVLSRKKNESIDIVCNGVAISIVVVEIRGDKTRLGIDAPKEVIVHRREVAQAIARKGILAKSPQELAQLRDKAKSMRAEQLGEE